jgi:hypothetical protein
LWLVFLARGVLGARLGRPVVLENPACAHRVFAVCLVKGEL